MYAVIIAGGRGTRFWPWSRRDKPKQFLPIAGAEPLLLETINRVQPDIPNEHIIVVTSNEFDPLIKEIAPGIPSDNFIFEPVGRNTAPAIGLAAVALLHRDPEAVMVVLPSDHTIGDAAAFRAVLAQAGQAAVSGEAIITIGIQPKFPETGYGYIRINRTTQLVNGILVHKVVQFKEKPDEKTAARYFASGEYLWNSGIFIAKARTLLQAIARFLPQDHQKLMIIADHFGSSSQTETIAEQFPQLTEISIDYGIMQEYPETFTIPAQFGWNDVGSFRALYDLHAPDENGNIALSQVFSENATGCLVRSSEKPVAIVGVKDLIVIDTADVLLVCHKFAAQQVSTLVKKLNSDARSTHLI